MNNQLVIIHAIVMFLQEKSEIHSPFDHREFSISNS